ncbi:sugar ABC transporter substrate-binding protein [Kitasatospora sp. NBC_00240]|uniref:sugar ABC transporter substrate-binding protein n=1 Tax=Kitasatospora sp. NBC_00240 TaxID=2903567 RepID=UPI00224F314D|nr:sugar ABC transporter substrate-binding protein [Kitasatospora sp. NBC_00240]MCX5215482.1 sugar ABC transporter substrate-binding protein [Kitasatospora sp. NBC_00240]
MKINRVRLALVSAAAAGGLLLGTSCAAHDAGTATSQSSAEASAGGHKHIAFFGFARANSFASATWAGIQEYAGANDADAEFFDPNFDAQTQVRQIQDAVTSKRFDVFIVQANNGAAVIPAVKQAIAAGITVVAEFTPVGTRYDTATPQVPGTITVLDVPVDNGRKLGELALKACESKKANPCEVAYLEGLRTLPLDNARTQAAVDVLSKAQGVKLVARLEGGYTQESGRKAMQDVLQSDPSVDVVIGSSQAIAGAEGVLHDKGVLLVANGGSRQAVTAVREGRWFATYYLPEKTAGAKAAEVGLGKARGQDVPEVTVEADLAPNGGIGTKDALANVVGEYDD